MLRNSCCHREKVANATFVGKLRLGCRGLVLSWEPGWGAPWAGARAAAPGAWAHAATTCREPGHRTAPLPPLPTGKASTGTSSGLLSCLCFSLLDGSNSLEKVTGRGVVKRGIPINVGPSHFVCTSGCGFQVAFLPSANKERGLHSPS